jgi:diguanylate cyclase (GGDEF)-like protein
MPGRAAARNSAGIQMLKDRFPKMTSQFAPSGAMRWRPLMLTAVIVWGAIGAMFVQSFLDYRAAEDRAYKHLVDVAHQIKAGIEVRLASNRLLMNAVQDLVDKDVANAHICRLVCPDDLRHLLLRLRELLPGAEIVLLDPNGELAAQTDPQLYGHLPGLRDLAARHRDGGAGLGDVHYIRSPRGEPALQVNRALRGPNGELQGVLVVLEPLAMFDVALDVPQLGAAHFVALIDQHNTLIARKPKLLVAALGEQAPPRDWSRTATHPDSYYLVSPFDGLERLAIRSQVSYAVLQGNFDLLVGIAKDEYLADWRASALLNGFISAALLLSWTAGVVVARRRAQAQAQLQATSAAMQAILQKLPVLVALVSQRDGTIVSSNSALIDTFGAVAGVGQPISRLFRRDDDWAAIPDSNAITTAELVARHGDMYAEVHCVDIGALDIYGGPVWLVALTDVSARQRREILLRSEASTDSLTGLANRRHFNAVAEQAIEDARLPGGGNLAVLALDLDHFKRVNDQYGHDIGDLVLSTVARLFKASLREGDLAARMGGEEFALLMPNASHERALAVGERIRQLVAATPVLLPAGDVLTMTISIGVALYRIGDADIQGALKRADSALYEAKKAGRNQVVAYREPIAA